MSWCCCQRPARQPSDLAAAYYGDFYEPLAPTPPSLPHNMISIQRSFLFCVFSVAAYHFWREKFSTTLEPKNLVPPSYEGFFLSRSSIALGAIGLSAVALACLTKYFRSRNK